MRIVCERKGRGPVNRSHQELSICSRIAEFGGVLLMKLSNDYDWVNVERGWRV